MSYRETEKVGGGDWGCRACEPGVFRSRGRDGAQRGV